MRHTASSGVVLTIRITGAGSGTLPGRFPTGGSDGSNHERRRRSGESGPDLGALARPRPADGAQLRQLVPARRHVGPPTSRRFIPNSTFRPRQMGWVVLGVPPGLHVVHDAGRLVHRPLGHADGPHGDGFRPSPVRGRDGFGRRQPPPARGTPGECHPGRPDSDDAALLVPGHPFGNGRVRGTHVPGRCPCHLPVAPVPSIRLGERVGASLGGAGDRQHAPSWLAF